MNPDPFVGRAVVCFLGAAVLLGMGGLIYLVARANGTADAATLAVISGPTGTALGALGMVLVTRPNGKNNNS